MLIRSLRLAPPPEGAWHRIFFAMEGLEETTVPYVTLHDAAGVSLCGHLYLHALPSRDAGREAREMVWYVPGEIREARLSALGPTAGLRAEAFLLQPLGRAAAAMRLLRQAPRRDVVRLARMALTRPRNLRREMRHVLALTTNSAQVSRQSYATWIALFDQWSAADFPASPAPPRIAYIVLAQDAQSPALAATLASLAAQPTRPDSAILYPGALLRPAIAPLDADVIGILQAGEVLPPHATQLCGQKFGTTEIAITDEDDVAPDGTRHAPRFKPRPNLALMLSGTLSRGLWLVRRDTLMRHAPEVAETAEALRLATWLARYRADPRPFSRRIPYILAHRRPDAESAAPEALAEIVSRHLQGGGPAITPIAGVPLRFRLAPAAPEKRVTAIVPSTLRAHHSQACISAILDGTDHAGFELHVVVMQPGPLDACQRVAAEALGRHPNARVSWLEAPGFNFSTANNHVAARTQGDHILLLNDDVTPIRRDWLRWMCAFLHDPMVGMVGARLLYPDGSVQHGGIIMGLSGLCEHAHRHLPGDEPGYMSRAVLAQELSAVTAACMLVRRSLFEMVGGLDENYPSAFNDVDFALRVGETGHGIVYAPQAELHHHELLTYGNHYSGDRAAFQAAESRRVRQRWAAVCAEDPFHSPNLSLALGHEWRLAFPPRAEAESAGGHHEGTSPLPASVS
ncbi:glycosyltransferase family 2 protein [Falsiroseomonas sp. HC035]|uniref:glycosyltransferase family 2 protein n=1 Tax=Falsiroseomonas sp. HC035 TaxID=3390999 RepID=UPI003D31CF7B